MAVGAVKFWPQIQSKLGIGGDGKGGPKVEQPSSPAGTPVDRDDPSGFRYTDTPQTPTEPVEPKPDANFSPGIPAEPVTDPAVPEPAAIPKAVEVTEEDTVEGKAKAALEAALNSNTVDELANYVLFADRVKPLMEKHYAGKSPKVNLTSIIFETSTTIKGSKFHNYTFYIATDKQPMRFPVAVDETADGIKLDWESYIEMHDDLLGKFLSSPQSEPKTFRAIVRRSHYFGTDVPELGSRDCFRISTPIPGSEGYGFVKKKSDVAATCEKFEWDQVWFPIVTLRWTTPKNGKPYLEISKVVAESWRIQPHES